MGTKLVERLADLVPPLECVGPLAHGGHVVRQIGVEPPVPLEPPPNRPAAVDDDAEEPGAEPLRLPAARQRPVRPHEAVLQRFLSVFPVSQHVKRVAPELVAVARHQGGIGSEIAAERPGDQRGIAVAHPR